VRGEAGGMNFASADQRGVVARRMEAIESRRAVDFMASKVIREEECVAN